MITQAKPKGLGSPALGAMLGTLPEPSELKVQPAGIVSLTDNDVTGSGSVY